MSLVVLHCILNLIVRRPIPSKLGPHLSPNTPCERTMEKDVINCFVIPFTKNTPRWRDV
ncbi:hypothetical protein Sjap_020393 [Stephania japonica]|uniref:Uncharacterized protein n=1 Tax=Stephania japonica TaxID=461633 RepID=A0AAP0I0M7_9MAGN